MARLITKMILMFRRLLKERHHRYQTATILSLFALAIAFQNCASDVSFVRGNKSQPSGDPGEPPPQDEPTPSEIPKDVVPESTPPECISEPAPNLIPKLKFAWDWAGSTNNPASNNVSGTPSVADLDGDGIPEIVFVSYSLAEQYYGQGIVRILNGRTGQEIQSVPDPADPVRSSMDLTPVATTTPLLVDIDGDGKMEIVYAGTGPNFNREAYDRIIALNFDGTRRWVVQLNGSLFGCYGGVAAADFNGDGKAEIIADSFVVQETMGTNGPIARVGQMALRTQTGARAYSDATTVIARSSFCTSFAMSLNPDKADMLHWVNQRGVFEVPRNIVFDPSINVPGGWLFSPNNAVYRTVAAADMRSEKGVEVLSVTNGTVRLHNGLTGAVLWTRDLPKGHADGILGGAPSIGNFDADTELEVMIAGSDLFTILNSLTGAIENQFAMRTYSSTILGSSLFDLDGNGQLEIILTDETGLRIMNPMTAANSPVANPQFTVTGYPVPVDTDGDGYAELVVPAANPQNSIDDLPAGQKAAIQNPGPGLRVFTPTIGRWAKTGSSWNQYSFFLGAFKKDGTAASKTPTVPSGPRNFRMNKLSVFSDSCQQ